LIIQVSALTVCLSIMAVKTITIDMDSYNLLSSLKAENESFSTLIKRRLKPHSTAALLLSKLPEVALEPSTLDGIEHVYLSRSHSLAESPLTGDDA